MWELPRVSTRMVEARRRPTTCELGAAVRNGGPARLCGHEGARDPWVHKGEGRGCVGDGRRCAMGLTAAWCTLVAGSGRRVAHGCSVRRRAVVGSGKRTWASERGYLSALACVHDQVDAGNPVDKDGGGIWSSRPKRRGPWRWSRAQFIEQQDKSMRDDVCHTQF